jgi:hypothetical protein
MVFVDGNPTFESMVHDFNEWGCIILSTLY